MRYRFSPWFAAALLVFLLPRTLAATAGEVPSVHSETPGSFIAAAAQGGEPEGPARRKELAEAYRCFGEVYLELQEAQEAVASCGKAWALDPSSPDSAVCEARGFLALGLFEEAQRIYYHLDREHPKAAWKVLEAFHHALAAEGEAFPAPTLRRWVRSEEGIADPVEAGYFGLSTEVTVQPSFLRSETLLLEAVVHSVSAGDVVAAASLLVPLVCRPRIGVTKIEVDSYEGAWERRGFFV